jgi:hypothetical protein
MHGSFMKYAFFSRGARRSLFVFVIFFFSSLCLYAQLVITVTVAGAQPKEWVVGSFGPGNISAPGNNFTSTQPGPNPTITINLSGTTNAAAHTVTLSKAADSGTTWNGTYTLWIMPQSAGVGSGGGNSLAWNIPTGAWTQVPTAPATITLCTVKRNRTGITLQLELQNLTVTAGTTTSVPSFLTTLTYSYQ